MPKVIVPLSTFSTIAERLDISSYAVKRLISHKQKGDVTAGYIIHDVERLRGPIPMQKITDYILKAAKDMMAAATSHIQRIEM